LSDGTPAWIHRLDGRPRPITPSLPARSTSTARASDQDLDRVYRALLTELSLAPGHREQLERRGLVAVRIARAGYRSLPAACRAGLLRRLRERFSDQLLLATPGVIVRDGPHGRYLTLAGAPGLLIPARSAAGRVVGLIVRPDEPGLGGKYRWISSSGRGGPSPGARVHVPAGVGPFRRVVLTEGALKADVAHALSGRPIVGMPGPHVTNEAIATLQALSATEVLLALDSDAATISHVARAQYEGLKRLRAAGFLAGLVKWDPKLGKGIDDALLAERK
jgi:hypothetical protein